MDDFKEIEDPSPKHQFHKSCILKSKALQKYFDLDSKKEKSNQEDIIIHLFLCLDDDDDSKTLEIFHQLCNSLYLTGSKQIDDDIKSFIASSALNIINDSTSIENTNVLLQVISFMISSAEILNDLAVDSIIFHCLNLIDSYPKYAFDILQKVTQLSDNEAVLKQLIDICFQNFNINNVVIDSYSRFLQCVLKKNTSNDAADFVLNVSDEILEEKVIKHILKLIKVIAKHVDDIDVVASSSIFQRLIDSFLLHDMDIIYYNDFTSMLHAVGERVQLTTDLLSGLSDELMCIELLDETMNEYIEKTVSLLVGQFTPENVKALVEGGIISSFIQLCDEGAFYAKLVAVRGICQLVASWPSETSNDALEGNIFDYIDVLFQEDENDIQLGVSALTALHAYAESNGLSDEFMSQFEDSGLNDILEEKDIELF